ncbi:MAG: triphosphoribosyl-dephospho-CoA synthase, partial [Muribaculaceae bacterium]|nr:triphosphoribosyl-dephospho-CoA synthase [Muribaculaceae bacterium]
EFSPSKSLSNSLLTRIGTDAEKAMLEATGGKNTHKGAIFALGLAIVAAIKNHNDLTAETIQKTIKAAAETITPSTDTHGGVAKQQFGLKSALDMARDGYSELFNSWLPFMNSHADDQFCYHKTLLLIMSTLDDTNIVHRAGIEQAVYCKQQAADILNNFSIGRLIQFDQYCIKTISLLVVVPICWR